MACPRISCTARRWRSRLYKMHSAIGKHGKIFNHERDEIHEKGKTALRRRARALRQGPDEDSLGSARWRTPTTSCLQVEDKQTNCSLLMISFVSFVFFVVKRMSRPRSKKSITLSTEGSVVPIPDAGPARAKRLSRTCRRAISKPAGLRRKESTRTPAGLMPSSSSPPPDRTHGCAP